MPLYSPARRSRPSLLVRVLRPVGRAWLWAVNMRVVGEMPELAKFVIVAAPHKTNWDLPNALAVGLHYGIRIHWMGKDSLFKWPFGGLMRWLGGISIDRSRRNNAVQQLIDTFAANRELVLVIPPEGTRSDVTHWKSGFYHIAHGAGVPLVLAFVDYQRREIGVKSVFNTTGDYDADLLQIQTFYTPTTLKKAA